MAKSNVLETYREKRDFKKTSEPQGKKVKPSPLPIFVVQKHDARALHYDFRLEVGGLLKSWAVPKGPPLSTNQRRLAVQTEDHPLEYAKFQGEIPEGEYGAGTVEIWDKGTYTVLKDNVREVNTAMQEGIEKGHITFSLNGRRLKGGYSLIRTQAGSKPQWLLIKMKGGYASDVGKVEIDIEEKADKKGHKGKSKTAAKKTSGKATKSVEVKSGLFKGIPDEELAKVQKVSFPQWTEPMLATLTNNYFSNSEWVFERKFDGERCLAFFDGENINLLSRNRKKLNGTYPELVDAFSRIKSSNFIIDGEIVAFEGNRTSFEMLQNRMGVRTPTRKQIFGTPVFYYIFDIIYADGYDLSQLPLRHRRKILAKAISFKEPLRQSEYLPEYGEKYLRDACKQGWEGLIAKRFDSSYQHYRSADWLKFRCSNEQEFVVGGFTDPQGSRVGFGALLIGYYEGDGFYYAGKVGTGYDYALLKQLAARLKKLERKKSPFTQNQPRGKGIHWVDPKLVAQVAFTEWTRDGKLRHPRFMGLRRDKNPEDVVREKPKKQP